MVFTTMANGAELAFGDAYYVDSKGETWTLHKFTAAKVIMRDKHGTRRVIAKKDVPETLTYRPDLDDHIDPVDPRLPYDFDLCFDLKHTSQLKEKVVGLREDLKELEDMMKSHGIEL